jgi:uncharacterized membrane protein
MAKDTLDAPLDDGRILPAHIEDTIRAIAKLHADHERSATPMQRVVESLTGLLARPSFVAVVTLAVVAWIGANLGLRAPGHVPFDPPPFTWLQGLLALGAVYMAGLILGTQRRADLLASHREQLTLELAILAEQKTAKTIALLEELRRDLPMLHNRIDREAEAMSAPADPEAVLEAIKLSHEQSEDASTADISQPVAPSSIDADASSSSALGRRQWGSD